MNERPQQIHNHSVEPASTTRWLKRADQIELVLLSLYIIVNVLALWLMFGVDKHRAFEHMAQCQAMIVQPVLVFVLWLVVVLPARGKLGWMTIVSLVTILLVGCVNLVLCFYDALGGSV